jgi:LuxR family transcriptional regulator, transcriptional regulator of spore coat protein
MKISMLNFVRKFILRQFSNIMKDLTKREKEILQLIADELTGTEIANQMKITISTVETHRRNILKKVGVKSSIGLIKEAIKFGWIE